MKSTLKILSLISTLFLLSSIAAFAHGHKAKVFFIEPKDGATVHTTFKVKFGVKGMKLEPSGAVHPGAGHHHLIIDGAAVPKGEVVGKDDTHIHYGKGQTEAELTLKPGDHTLTLQFADGAHVSYGPEMSKTIHVHVE